MPKINKLLKSWKSVSILFYNFLLRSVAYLPPEILTKRPHSRTVDWYLLGTFLFELLVGIPPYYDNKKEVRNILFSPSHLKSPYLPKLLTFYQGPFREH